MVPKYHILFGAIFVLFLYFVYPQISILGLAVIFLSSFLIDADHVLYYIIRKKDFSLSRAYKWYLKEKDYLDSITINERNKIYSGFYIFHGIEILIVLFILGTYIYELFMFIFLGFSLHFILDIIHDFDYKRRFDKTSLIYNYFMFKEQKKN